MLAPCKDCKDRHAGCHSECGKYQEYAEYRRTVNDSRRQQMKVDDDFYRTRKAHSRKRGFGW